MRKLFILAFFSALLSYAQNHTEFIVIDQFGYRPNDEKIAIIRNPLTGYDSDLSFDPASEYVLVNAVTELEVHSQTISAWNNGAEDESSGDEVWHFNFSNFTEPGQYYVLDKENNVKSFTFEIRQDVYNDVLKHAVRTFFYQRAGFEKAEPYAEPGWADAASHIGPLQDTECRYYLEPNNAATERDVSGGWYDAGDYNKYTNWTSNYVHEMLLAYEENPEVWTDDLNIPESGNNIPDIIDEAKWGMDHLLKMQKEDGSMIAIVSLSHKNAANGTASPPSSAVGPSLYGGVNSSSTWNTAGTFAYGAKVFEEMGMTDYASTLKQAAIDAWEWARQNPDVVWRNNDASEPYNSQGIGAGQQEMDEYGRNMMALRAAVHLFEITGDDEFHTYFDENYDEAHAIAWPYVYPYETREQQILLYYTTLTNATATVVNDIKSKYTGSIEGAAINLPAYENQTDPYFAYLDSYTWGSNGIKGNQGSNLYNIITYGLNEANNERAEKAAEHYIHYIHGANPMNRTYLTNMYNYGGDLCANQIYHTWFYDGSALWDEYGVSTYGPAPGFLAGGANPSYDWDGCCPDDCGGTSNNALCTSMELTPPKNQPAQKSYLDFNDNWPLNSWAVTENSCGYQMSYIRLLSKFASAESEVTSISKNVDQQEMLLVPNPAKGVVSIRISNAFEVNEVVIVDALGKVVIRSLTTSSIDISGLSAGIYVVKVEGKSGVISEQLIVR